MRRRRKGTVALRIAAAITTNDSLERCSWYKVAYRVGRHLALS